MANSDEYTVTGDWTKVVANSLAITNGTFSIVNPGLARIYTRKSDVLPTALKSNTYIDQPKEFIKHALSATEFFYVRSDEAPVQIGVEPA